MTATPLSIPTTTLADGTAFPLVGFGTSSMKGVEGAAAIASALRSGYRLIDPPPSTATRRRWARDCATAASTPTKRW